MKLWGWGKKEKKDSGRIIISYDAATTDLSVEIDIQDISPQSSDVLASILCLMAVGHINEYVYTALVQWGARNNQEKFIESLVTNMNKIAAALNQTKQAPAVSASSVFRQPSE